MGSQLRPVAAIFAEDLLGVAETAFATFAPDRRRAGMFPVEVKLPVTVPVDSDGLVVVSAAPPELTRPDSVRRPGRLVLAMQAPPGRRGRGWALSMDLGLDDGLGLRIPGVGGDGEGGTAPLARLVTDVDSSGLRFTGFVGPGGTAVALDVAESRGRELATALLITVGVKVTKAQRLAALGGGITTPQVQYHER